MFSINMRLFMAIGQPYQPFKGQRPQERPKTFSACGSSGAAEIGRLQCLCVLCSTVCACARACACALPQAARQDRKRGQPSTFVCAAGLYHPPPPPF